MSKKIYSLNDIGKLLTYIPQIFLFLLASLLVVISFFIAEYQRSHDIKLVKEQQKYIKQKLLSDYINSLNLKINTYLQNTEQELKKNVYILKGLQVNISSTKTLIDTYIKDIESKKDIKFLLFDHNLNTLHGHSIIQNLERLIFNQANDPAYMKLTLLYLFSQGQSSSFSWKDDARQTIQLSYIEKSFDEKYFIGAFSSVGYQEKLIENAFLNSIRENKNDLKNYYFWLYNKSKRNAFNVDGKKKWTIAVNIKNENKIFHSFSKQAITIGITQKSDFVQDKIEEINLDYIKKRNFNIFIIIMFVFLLMAFSTLFSSFIKGIFASYNRRFENKNRQLKRLKQRYELAVIASNDGLWDTNLETGITFFSKKWLDMLGYKAGEISSYKEWLELLHEKDKDKIEKTIHEYIQSNQEEHLICEYRLKTKQGSYKWILARGKVFDNHEKKRKRLLMMTMDIDEKKEATKHLKMLVKDEVAKNEENQRLLIQQNKLASMGEMIGAIAHQWRQPLNNISLIIHFIRDNVKNKQFQENMLDAYIDRAKEQITYMSETIDDFRNFYKPSKSRSTFEVKKAIDATIDIIKGQIRKNDITINITGDPAYINGYKNEFKQAILNILTNAKDAIRSEKIKNQKLKGEIDITVLKKNQKTLIHIFNNGGNSSLEILERMFEPYFTTKFEDKGTGIGLYMTKTIIETSMNGTITAHNIKEGMQFNITI